MNLQKITYRNFRNYGKKGEVVFSKNGKITLIYGTNGDGKTTFHQLFKWILYGEVTFNNTTSSNRLYNLQNGATLHPDSSSLVWGEIEFEHEGIKYIAHREWAYYKNSSGKIYRKPSGDCFYVQRLTENNDWRNVDQPEALIDSILPSGLSPYFFFDGETMIADLRKKGSESAKSLNLALTILFDLYIYQRAIDDIGNTRKKSTALGKLDSEKVKIAAKSTQIDAARFSREINLYDRRLEASYEEKRELTSQLETVLNRIKQISELIGTSQSKQKLETDRQDWKDTIDGYQKDISRIRLEYGKAIENTYSFLLINAVVKDAEQRMYLKVQSEKKKLIPGLRKELLNSLLRNQDECICGNPLNHAAREHLEEWLSYFPPASYKATYDKFKSNVNKHSGSFDEEKLCRSYLTRIFDKYSKIRKCEKKIEDIDEELKECGDIDHLIDERKYKEEERKQLEKRIAKVDGEIASDEKQRKLRIDKLAKAEKGNDQLGLVYQKINLMQRALDLIITEKKEQTEEYSKTLESEIQKLVNSMLTSKRRVELSSDFVLKVIDSYQDESKSEGQFAVVSFAYISAILKVLQTHDRFRGREYPLVLDGPFSKLDPQQKKNVLETLPKYANQVIILSKDPLQDAIDPDSVGKIYTIKSNDEKNYAEIKEGYLW